MPSDQEPAYVDGNAAAGELQQLFAIEVTSMSTECVGCGDRAELGRARVYQRAPGLVVRCSGCDGVLIRVVRSSERAWLDVRGVSQLTFATA